MNPSALYRKALELTENGRSFSMAEVIWSSGSTPQKAGAMALFEANGSVWGTLGGGCLEAESRQRALEAIDSGQARVFDLKLDEVDNWDDGLICGGRVRVMVDPNTRENRDVYRQFLAAGKERKPGLLAVVIRHPDLTSGRTFWAPQHKLEALPVGIEPDAIHQFLKAGRPGALRIDREEDGAAIEVYLEPMIPQPRLIIAGAGNIGRATAHQGFLLGFEVTVIDDRPLYANRDNFPDTDHVICGDIAGEITQQDITRDTYIVIVTRGHRRDRAVLENCIHSPAAYIGMIGSRRKSKLIRDSLVKENTATQAEIDRVVSPMGLDIGAESVEEIALSIASQLVGVRRRGSLCAGSKSFS